MNKSKKRRWNTEVYNPIKKRNLCPSHGEFTPRILDETSSLKKIPDGIPSSNLSGRTETTKEFRALFKRVLWSIKPHHTGLRVIYTILSSVTYEIYTLQLNTVNKVLIQ